MGIDYRCKPATMQLHPCTFRYCFAMPSTVGPPEVMPLSAEPFRDIESISDCMFWEMVTYLTVPVGLRFAERPVEEQVRYE